MMPTRLNGVGGCEVSIHQTLGRLSYGGLIDVRGSPKRMYTVHYTDVQCPATCATVCRVAGRLILDS
jgi:hypothetical protein